MDALRNPAAIYSAYSAAWNQRDDSDLRTRLLDQAWADDGVFVDEDTPGGLVGRAALSEYIAATHEAMPGLVITEISPPQVVGNRLRVRWSARQARTEMFTGTDFIEFAPDGRISRVTMFYDSTPGEDEQG